MKSNQRRSGKQRSCLSVEQLEIRRVLSGFQPTAAEQLLLEQLNDIRANPVAYGTSIGLDLSGVTPAQPLAFDPLLVQAARLHSQDMNARGYFDHNTPDNVDPGERLTNAGFPWASWGESLGGGTAYPDSASVLKALIIDPGITDIGHRKQLLALDSIFQTQNQVGVGIVQGGTGPLVNYYTIDTAATNDGTPFLTGVVFADKEGTGRYDIGEGVGHVLITIDMKLTTFMGVPSQLLEVSTWDSGGYSFQLGPGTYTVTASGGGLAQPITQTVTVGTTNARLNFVVPPNLVQPQANAWVSLLYHDVLGRSTSGAELAGWVSGFGNNVPHEAVAGAFLGSAENSVRLVSHWYGQFLQRAPDDGGLSGFAQALQSGGTESTIRSIILSSDEYFADHGGTAGSFVQGLYNDLLGRAPAGHEADSWIAKAAAGNRAAVAAGIQASQEFKTDEVQSFYAAFLRRQADTGGLNHFVAVLNQGADERTVLRGILGSQEYSNSSEAILWLQNLYQDVLGRSGDNARELGRWLANLNLSNDRTGIALGFVSSTEADRHVVTGLYQQLLARAPDDPGMQSFVSVLQATGNENNVIIQMASSPEYYALHQSNNTQFIRGLYFDLLARGSSNTEVEIWLNKLNTGETRARVITEFLASPEYQQFDINRLYTLYLHRQPSKLEMDQTVSQIQSGATDATIAAALLAGNEYFLFTASGWW